MAVHVCARTRSDAHRRASRPGRATALLAASALLAACAAGDDRAADAPETTPAAAEGVSLDNCDVTVELDRPAEQVVGLNSGSVDLLLALEVDDQLVGALGREESIAEPRRDAFAQLPQLDAGDDDYPPAEVVLASEPDLLYSVYPSAYRDTGIASRDELAALGVASYLAPGRCPDRDDEQPLTFNEIWQEVREVGALVGAERRAETLIAEQEDAIAQARAQLPDVDDLEVFWWDVGTDEPLTGACCGAPGMIMDELGVTNVFDDLPGHWASVGWEQVIERDPDVIVLVDFGDDDVDEKLAYLEQDATLSQLRAFQDDAIVVVPFAQTTPGLQNVDAIDTIGAFLAERA